MWFSCAQASGGVDGIPGDGGGGGPSLPTRLEDLTDGACSSAVRLGQQRSGASLDGGGATARPLGDVGDGERSLAGAALQAQIWALWARSGYGRAGSGLNTPLLVGLMRCSRRGWRQRRHCRLQRNGGASRARRGPGWAGGLVSPSVASGLLSPLAMEVVPSNMVAVSPCLVYGAFSVRPASPW